MTKLKRADLFDLVKNAVEGCGGEATPAQAASWIWQNHEDDLRSSGELFFTWQYDMRWAAQALRKAGKLTLGRRDGKATWVRKRG